MSIYDDMRAVTNELMPQFKQGTINYVEYTVPDGAAPDEAGTPVPVVSPALNATAKPVSTKYVDGSLVVQTDKQVTIPNDGNATPTMKGFLRIDGVDHKMVALMARPAAGDPIVWTAIVRR